MYVIVQIYVFIYYPLHNNIYTLGEIVIDTSGQNHFFPFFKKRESNLES